MSVQAKSDVILVFLLYNYGGVWLGATVCMTESLQTWLRMDVDFTTFIRHDEAAENYYYSDAAEKGRAVKVHDCKYSDHC